MINHCGAHAIKQESWSCTARTRISQELGALNGALRATALRECECVCVACLNCNAARSRVVLAPASCFEPLHQHERLHREHCAQRIAPAHRVRQRAQAARRRLHVRQPARTQLRTSQEILTLRSPVVTNLIASRLSAMLNLT